MKKLIVCVLSLVLALSLAACGGKNGEVPTPTTNDGNSSYTSDGTMIPGSDPIVVCCWFAWRPKQAKEPEQGLMSTAQIETVDSLAALSKKTGMDMKELTGLPFAVEQTEYVSYWGALAEIQYFGGTENLCYRKSQGTEDNSGDYNVYTQVETLEIAGMSVTLKGENGAFSLAAWTDGQFAYSICVSTPLSEEAFSALLEENI